MVALVLVKMHMLLVAVVVIRVNLFHQLIK
jgi:hypothetical protein